MQQWKQLKHTAKKQIRRLKRAFDAQDEHSQNKNQTELTKVVVYDAQTNEKLVLSPHQKTLASMPIDYKRRYKFQKRFDESSVVLHQCSVPVILLTSERRLQHLPPRIKMAFGTPMHVLLRRIRERMRLPPEQALFGMVHVPPDKPIKGEVYGTSQTVMLCLHESVGAVWNTYHHADQSVYISILFENVFG